jgi:hypothetical protein
MVGTAEILAGLAAAASLGTIGSHFLTAANFKREAVKLAREEAADEKAQRREEHLVFATTECPNKATIEKLFEKVDEVKSEVKAASPNGDIRALAAEVRALRRMLEQ